MKRTLPPLRLAGSPLVLVLCQVRIAAVRDMASYIPALQDRLRRDGFPVDVSKEVLDLSLQAQGPATERRRAHWEFRSLDEDRSIIVGDGAVIVQTTAYDCFESFLTTLSFAMAAVDAAVGDLVVERVGLRYVDFIDPRPGESWKDYVKPGYHGQENDIVRPETSVHFAQTVADTGPGQQMIVRLTQNRDGNLLPPDLVLHHPVLAKRVEPGNLATLLDLDHYREARQPFEIGKVVETAWRLHDGLDVMFRDVVTSHALEVWSKEP